jgi:hypothetical protein
MSHVCFIERWEERLWQVESKLRTDSREVREDVEERVCGQGCEGDSPIHIEFGGGSVVELDRRSWVVAIDALRWLFSGRKGFVGCLIWR